MKIITVEHLSKYYTIGHDRNSGAIRYKTFRESMMSAGRSLYQRLRHPLSPNREQVELEEFKALDDVSFEVEQGDRIGIIGRNGAGKSTLLKLLCRITEPTKGRITMHGRAASLLEVGTGFHPELSGRENIYLNGAILGMKRAEIKRKFDEIVDFSGVEKFLDTPVKRYSSGMYVRLAFAVAAHLESEILLIDEVLAVGDAEFQKKCLGKMDDISKTEGRTILFVSHNMNAVMQLCNRGIFLQSGLLKAVTTTVGAIQKYQDMSQDIVHEKIINLPRMPGCSGAMRFTGIEFYDPNGKKTQPQTGKSLTIRLKFKTDRQKLKNCRVSIGFDHSFSSMFLLTSDASYKGTVDLNADSIPECHIPKLPLVAGTFFLSLFCEINGNIADWVSHIPVHVEDGSFYGTPRNTAPGNGWEKLPLIEHHWTFRNKEHVKENEIS